ncbi:DUF429 domain-containing protein [Mariprofundus erugo]|uniref:DUF429 domain-containing protein n=1 Tax=Mariprofundus erugo TaxID=2528639 RepID=A0A5R9GRZ3_9PROT|nr:ribonuclease H-like domain-containing protein [Mariprofundus erugo]TLS67037.1 DUF429 domain-containing protein [Mariprofundus erugo]
MLTRSFRHLDGIGEKKERELWNAGVYSWAEFCEGNRQLSFFPEDDGRSKLIEASQRAFLEGDADYFAEHLPSSEHYRIALTYPEKTMFLDIETTGLSKYYDQITLIGWSMGKDFQVYVQGQDIGVFQRALNDAKAIVTFNGAIFDIPFIKSAFQDIHFPKAHIDLRFFGKQFGLSGGQKEIEVELGIKRTAELKGIQGEAAPILWHKYRRGDLHALKLLIKYNQADIEGMKTIFDVAITRLIAKRSLPVAVCKPIHFARMKSKVRWKGDAKIQVSLYDGEIGPKIRYSDLNVPSGFKVAGIDLTGSEDKATGWCLLEGNRATTKRILTDAELVAETIKANPDVISIDSPLSIPKGRIRVTDDDPGRDEFGIMRGCERTLKKRGVNVYPSLIPSMQQLTARGMRLADRFRKLGFPVIESYPGAAQDIMGIPRKGAGVEFLLEGLVEFGVEGAFQTEPVSHDELDAITSSIVGLFFWVGKFEALGNEDEEYLIIPDLDVDTDSWLNRRVVGFSGPVAAGKTTAARFLEELGYSYARFSNVLEAQLVAKGEPVSRERLQVYGQEVHEEFGQRWLCGKLVQMLPDNGNCVIDGLRFPEDYAFMVESFGPAFRHYYIEASTDLRAQRYGQRNSSNGFSTADAHAVEQSIEHLKGMALETIENQAGLDVFERMIKHLAL